MKIMKSYKLTFCYNGVEYKADIANHNNHIDLDKTDATIIVEAIIEKQIKYVEGAKVQGLKIEKIESEAK